MADLVSYGALYQAMLSSASKGKPFVLQRDRVLSLHFEPSTVQSIMRREAPDELVLAYTRTLMAFLLFQPTPARIAMIGLGGGSLAKYCLRHLPRSHFVAVEINPDVIALRTEFGIPPDSDRFRVLCADGAGYVRDHSDDVDVLIVDGFDRRGQPHQLCSQGFYDHCFAKLSEVGVLAVNLWGGDLKYGTCTSRIRQSFGDKVITIDSEDPGNKVVFAYKEADFPLSQRLLDKRVLRLSQAHPISFYATAEKILRRLRRRTARSDQLPLDNVTDS